ncbi:unnamed protein product [Leuciscus chuanchicus]
MGRWICIGTRRGPGPFMGPCFNNKPTQQLVITYISQVGATAPLPSNAPLPATASLVANETFLKDQTLFLIDLMRLQTEAEGKGLPRSLHDLNHRLKLVRKSKKLLWEDITGKLSHHFKQTFVQDKVARKWNTLVEAYKKMDDLLGGHHDIVFPVVGTTMGLDVHRPDALQVNVSAPDISPAQSTSAPSPVRLTNSPSSSSPPSPPPSSCVPHPTVTTMPP